MNKFSTAVCAFTLFALSGCASKPPVTVSKQTEQEMKQKIDNGPHLLDQLEALPLEQRAAFVAAHEPEFRLMRIGSIVPDQAARFNELMNPPSQ